MPVLAKLFEEFPPVTTQEWIEKIIADLRGDELRRRLVWRTDEGLKLMPFYRREDIQNFPHIISLPGDFPWVRGSKTDSNNWLVRQNIEVDNYKESNKKALNILGKGVD
ncbi:MAG: methylmalonyl-CoA mutase family protein, partial [Bacteroidales bacterium]